MSKKEKKSKGKIEKASDLNLSFEELTEAVHKVLRDLDQTRDASPLRFTLMVNILCSQANGQYYKEFKDAPIAGLFTTEAEKQRCLLFLLKIRTKIDEMFE